MNDEYLDAFIRESEEAITELNNSLLALESDPADREAMDRIFRTAHTLKGNFGAMGFSDAADLAHAVEDLLDAMRQGDLEVTAAVMDLVFAGVDELEAIIRHIEEHGESAAETGAIVEQLRTTLEEGAAAADDPAATDAEVATDTSDGGPDPAATAADHGSVGDRTALSPAAADDRIVCATVGLGDTDMPGVDGMLALQGIDDAVTVLDTDPGRAAIEDGEYDATFDVFVDASDPTTVEDAIGAVGNVATVAATDVTDALGEATASAAGGGSPADDADEPDGDRDEHDHAVQEIKSVRVDVEQLDDLHGLVEQLVTSRIKLRRAIERRDTDQAGDHLNELDKITATLQNTVMDVRIIPLRNVVRKFPRMVRDLARDLDKDVEFDVDGEDIELDRTILTEISDPLMHVIRNALDHGIEPPAEREAAGKPQTGHVELRADRERDHVVIEVADDGAGLDVDAIRRTAAERGIRSPEELEAMDASAIYDLVFHPGFSTADEVSETSGRGVGMDVVHDTVSQLDGSVNVESTPGEGTTVRLRLPVTMAIVKVLFVSVGDEEYGVPLKHVDEITRATEVERLDGREVVRQDDGIYPVVDLAETFDVPGEAANGDGGETRNGDGGDATNGDGMLVRIRESERQVALRCDTVESQEEVVVKPLEGILSGTSGLSGTAVLGDGNIVHILDVVTL